MNISLWKQPLLARSKILVLTVISLLVVGIVIVGVLHFKANTYRDSGKDYIPKAYSQLKLPLFLQYKEGSWNDVHATDRSLESAWFYSYTSNSVMSNEQTVKALLSNLQKQGFRISDQGGETDSDNYYFSADSTRLKLYVTVNPLCTSDARGVICPPKHSVSISASLPADKAGLSF